MNKYILAWVALMLMVGTSFAQAESIKYRANSSGWAVPSQEQDVDMDPDQSGNLSNSKGESNLGSILSNTAGDIAPWDNVTVCDRDEDGNAIAIEQIYLKSTGVTVFENGDILATEIDSSLPSTLCVYFNRGVNKFTIYRNVTGGTGRFKGATGSITITGRSRGLDGQSYFKARTRGVIHLQ